MYGVSSSSDCRPGAVARPTVTVVVPVLDEALRLADCIDALAAQDLEPGAVEVLVVDGGSRDGTAEAARRLVAGRGWWRSAVLHCPAGDRSSNLNHGLDNAAAPVVVRVDARSRVPRHYLRRCLELLTAHPDAAVVGGRQRAVPAGAGPVDVGVARALNNRWGMGLARYRRGAASGRADTVYLGAYRTAQLRQVGGWRPDLAVNEDFDVNRRLRPLGTVWFDAGLEVDYLPRSSWPDLVRQYWQFGQGKARYWRLSGDAPRPRQLVLLGLPVAALALVVAAQRAAGPVGAGVVVAAGAVGAVALEGLGAESPRGGLLSHLAAVGALATVAGAWLAGVGRGLICGPPRPPAPEAFSPPGRASSVSLCIVCHNRPQELEDALASAGDGFDEVLVLDMASDPPLRPVAGVTWMRSDTNLGVTAGRNRLAGAARGDVLVFLDDDAVFLSPVRARVLDAFGRDATLGALAFRVRRPGSGGVSSEHPFRGKGRRRHDVGRRCAYFVGCGYAVSRRAHLSVGGYDDRFFYSTEEVDLGFRVLGAGWHIRYDPDLVIEHRASPRGRSSTSQVAAWRMRNRLLLVRAHLPVALAVPHAVVWAVRTGVDAARRRDLRRWARFTREGLVLPVVRRPLGWAVLARAQREGGRVLF